MVSRIAFRHPGGPQGSLGQNVADVVSLLWPLTSDGSLRIRASELDPGHGASHFRYAAQMRQDGGPEKAQRLLTRAVALQPMSPRYRMEQTGALRVQGGEPQGRTGQGQGSPAPIANRLGSCLRKDNA